MWLFRSQPPLGPPPRSARERTLAQWRGHDFSEQEKALQARVRTPAELLPQVLKTLRLESRREEAEILRVWQELMDPEVVAHARPTGLKQGTLFVSVDSNVWLAELVGFRRTDILRRLQQVFGATRIQKISFRVG
ncbi:MAG: DUF721 domain-containing protein [Verrucomicrobiota bacterium]|nr:DUF721 domain-containing protein [Limisphaera sp.]MDW8381722.1 DUF721 domain-containing protein [Verrucomicrobiota bacterium]